MDYDGWDEKTIQSSRSECHCCNYWRLKQISGARKIRFYKIVIVVLVFVTSLALLALSLRCHWSDPSYDEDDASSGVVTDDRRLPIEQETSAEMTSSRDPPSDGDAPKSLFRAKRGSGRQNNPSRIPTSSRKRNPSEKKKRETEWKKFQRKIANAKSYCDVAKLVRNTGLASRLCPSKKSSKGHRKTQQQRPSSLTTTTTMMTTTTKEICPMKNVSIVGSFDQAMYGTSVEFRVCDQKDSTRDEDEDRREKHKVWMNRAQKKGVCRPMSLVVDFLPEMPPNGHPSPAIAMVRRCALLYKPIKSEDVTPECHSVKSVKRTVHFEVGGHTKSYEFYDDVICLPRGTSDDEESDENHASNGKRCPWPFRKRKAGHCSCRPKAKDSAGYLIYLSCRRIEKGLWKLQNNQQECVRLDRCLPPKCDGTRVYDPGTGRCLLAQQRHTPSPASASPVDGQRPTRTAQEATKSPADT